MKQIVNFKKVLILFIFMFLSLILFRCSEEVIHFSNDTQMKYDIKYNQNYDTLSFNGVKYILYNPYKNSGNLNLKGAMHVHSENSSPIDGYWSSRDPKWVGEKMRDEGGYDFYTITDHNYITNDPKVSDIVWMGQSVEDTKINQHIIAYNLPFDNYVNVGEDMLNVLDYYKDIGAYTSLAHPNWLPVYISDEAVHEISKVTFMEVVNQDDKGHRALDILTTKKSMTFALGVDDFHYNTSWSDPNMLFKKGWIIAFAEEKEKESIWKSLLHGAFYVTTGPEINIKFEQGVFRLSTNEMSKITFIGLSRNGDRITEYSNNVTENSYDWNDDLVWLRAEILNSKGIAFTQSIQLVQN
jgi:hypothetical protein